MNGIRHIGLTLFALMGMILLRGRPAADSPHAAIMVITRSYGDSVVLRWAPTTPGAWRLASQYGYRIYRRRLEKSDLGLPELLTPTPIHPWPPETWKQQLDTTNRFMLMAAEVLYGRTAPPARGISGLLAAAELLRNRFAFALFAADMDRLAAQGLGLRFVDTTITPGETYLYTVTTAVPDSLYPIEAGDAAAATAVVDQTPRPIGVVAREGDGKITLQWMDHPGLTAYWIERSDDRGKTYWRLNRMPYTRLRHARDSTPEMHFVDATVRNYVRYYYRVIGITPFGELSEPVTVSAMARDLTPPAAPVLETAEVKDQRRVVLRWTYPDTANDAAGFLIMRSHTPQKDYAPIVFPPLPPSARTFVDTQAVPEEPYYIVTALDTGGNAALSLPYKVFFVDTFPPSPPIGLTGTIDSQGVVRLRWRSNMEPDLFGYRVLRANAPDHEFTQLTNRPIHDTFFVDTINLRTLTRYVYYRVSALDVNYNHSPMSAMLRLRRPDRTAPVPAVFRAVVPSDSGVWLRWSAGTSEDAAFQRIQRRISDSTSWKNLATLPPGAGRFTDKAVEAGITYDYRVLTFDSAGLFSSSDVVTARPYPAPLKPPAFVRLQYDSTSSTISLQWHYPYPMPSKGYFIVYRATKDRALTPYRTLPLSANAFHDRLLPTEGLYRYAVKIARRPFDSSPLSRVVSVEVR